MKNNLSALVVGVIFSIGLGISGMTQPAKVVGFLDVFGHWDPSLMFVMMGAVGVHGIAYRLILKRKSPVFSKLWHVPSREDLTPALIIGAFIFGIGWGLGGYCPGPAVTSLASLKLRPVVFVGSMVLGMILFRVFNKKAHIRESSRD